MSKHLLLVLGMHRSGTSLIAKAMECFGAALGPMADWRGDDNPLGFWEDQDVLLFNEKLLKSMGTGWADPRPFTQIEQWVKLNGNAVEKAYWLLSGRLKQFPLFALKEPRLCRLLPFWRRPIGALGCKVSVVHVVRHPGAVAASMVKRDDMPASHGFALWSEYVRSQFAEVPAHWPSVTVDYDDMMDRPSRQFDRIEKALGLEYDVRSVDTLIHEYIDDSLRRSERLELPPTVAEIWKTTLERTI